MMASMLEHLKMLEGMTEQLHEPDLISFPAMLDMAISKYLYKNGKVSVQYINMQSGMSLPVELQTKKVLVIVYGALQAEINNAVSTYHNGEVLIIPHGGGCKCEAITDVQIIAINIPTSEE